MKDLNFFSIYQTNIKERKNDNIEIYIAAAIIASLLFAHFAYSTVKYFCICHQISSYEEQLNSPETKQKMAEADDVNTRLQLLTKYDESLNNIDKQAKKIDIVTAGLLEDISKSVPHDITFTKWSSENYTFTIEGTSSTRTSVAEFEHNLKQYPRFKVVHVDKVEVGETAADDYKFKLRFVLKEGE